MKPKTSNTSSNEGKLQFVGNIVKKDLSLIGALVGSWYIDGSAITIKELLATLNDMELRAFKLRIEYEIKIRENMLAKTNHIVR